MDKKIYEQLAVHPLTYTYETIPFQIYSYYESLLL